ncbi:nucleoside hydrolase [Brucella tritici]|uniref:nucleoside hydrolase n=1 Tax=Brucella tritici TaxID=94626 RepID=UPI000DD7277F|nr:nucleoside hydrolase [Brucella tritici]
MKQIPVIMDCDPGHDDAIALVMAHKSDAINLLGVTTVCGNATLERTTINALRILEFIGAGDVPVAQGCGTPLNRPLVLGTADGPSGLEGTPDLPEPTMKLVDMHAVDFIAKILREHPEPVTLAPTGPLTNIAMLLLKYPELKPKIARIVSMGGAFFRRTEYITPTEFNIFCDPEAARIVMDSGIDVTMVGLDVTMHVLVEEEQFEELRKIDTPLGKAVLNWLKFYEKLHRGQMGVGGALHDPLVLATIIDPSLIEKRRAHVAVDLTGTYTFGATVADYWQERRLPDNVWVATRVNSEGFFDQLYSLLR